MKIDTLPSAPSGTVTWFEAVAPADATLTADARGRLVPCGQIVTNPGPAASVATRLSTTADTPVGRHRTDASHLQIDDRAGAWAVARVLELSGTRTGVEDAGGIAGDECAGGQPAGDVGDEMTAGLREEVDLAIRAHRNGDERGDRGTDALDVDVRRGGSRLAGWPRRDEAAARRLGEDDVHRHRGDARRRHARTPGNLERDDVAFGGLATAVADLQRIWARIEDPLLRYRRQATV